MSARHPVIAITGSLRRGHDDRNHDVSANLSP